MPMRLCLSGRALIAPRLGLLVALCIGIGACGDEAPHEAPELACAPGTAMLCVCEAGVMGSQVCATDGQSFEPCVCGWGPAQDGGNNGPTNNGPANNGPANNGPANNGPANNGTANNGPANNGPANNGPANNGPPPCESDEDCDECGGAATCACAAIPDTEGTYCVPACAADEDCPDGPNGPLECDVQMGICVPGR